MDKTLYLIDGTAMLYRSHFAFIKNPLVNSQGQHTSAIFGTVNSFLHFVEQKEPEYIAVSFDRKAPTFRHEMSEDYKANRPPMPEELVSQLEPVHEFFRLIGLPEISLDGYEADDVLATLAERFKGTHRIVFVTGDKDYSQLLEDGVGIFDPAKDLNMDSEAVFAKFGVWPHQFIDYLALVGDASDNIPGVRGIGPKGAEKLLQEYGDLDSIYAHLEEMKPNMRQKLEENRDNAFLSRELATIVRDVPLTFPAVEETRFDAAKLCQATELLEKYELHTLKRRIENRFGKKAAAKPVDTHTDEGLVQSDIFGGEEGETMPEIELKINAILADKENLPALLEQLKSAESVALDTETDSLDPISAKLVGISLCVKEDEAWYLPLGHKDAENLPLEETLTRLRQALAGKSIIGHNLKFDLMVLKNAGWDLDNPIWDTMLAAYILDPGENRFSLDNCVLRELGHTMIPISALLDKKEVTSFDLVELEKARDYAAEDAWATFRLAPLYRRRLSDTQLLELYDNIELPLLPVLQRMEENGVKLDTEVLAGISQNIQKELQDLEKKIHDYAGYEFNINSTQQLAKVLFQEKKLPPGKKTKSGFSTDNSVLEELAGDYEIADTLIQYRALAKLDSTYAGALPKLINPATGRIHSSFNQTVASTGRLSSSNPNLQNIPVRTDLGRSIRKAFVASSEDWVIMAADYSQIELRLLALFSRDEVLLDAFRHEVDIHRQTASIITGKPLQEVSAQDRHQAKTINFGLLYGMGQKKLSRELGISQPEAKAMIQNYFERFPSIQAYISQSKAEARLHLYAQTIFGRRLYLKNLNSVNAGLRSEAERVAVNMPIQGSAADLIKIAMIRIHALLKDEERIRMILQVHDELVFEVHRDFLDEAKELVRREMEGALPEKWSSIVALKTDIGVGNNWFEAH
ncbi:MAG: DNA polymerase I [Candidatus Cloacimonetes bacterium]|nr:DNA polymerase I [Candidatus Cloacimonadota bacterium]